MNQADQIPKNHGAKAGDDAQAERQQGELRQRQLLALLAVYHVRRRLWDELSTQPDAVGRGISTMRGSGTITPANLSVIADR